MGKNDLHLLLIACNLCFCAVGGGVSVLALKVCAEAQNDNPLNWSPDMVAKLREGFELADTDEPKKFLTRKELASAFEKFGFQFLLNSIDLVYEETMAAQRSKNGDPDSRHL